MALTTYDGLDALARRAGALTRADAVLPGLLVLSDPQRTPDPVALAQRLPAACGLILRTFGRKDIEAQARDLAQVCAARRVALLISADPDLAAQSGADGVHWPQWALSRVGRPWPGALVTASVHDAGALRRAQPFVDAVLVSTAFPSASPSAGRPIGAFRLAAFARRSRAPVYALGGVNAKTVRRLEGLGVRGAAAVGAAGRG